MPEFNIKHDFTRQIVKKGWEAQQAADYWGITPRHLSRIAVKPTKRDLKALEDLPSINHLPKDSKGRRVYKSSDVTPKLLSEAAMKGWTPAQIARRWKITINEVYQRAARPKIDDIYEFTDLKYKQ